VNGSAAASAATLLAVEPTLYGFAVPKKYWQEPEEWRALLEACVTAKQKDGRRLEYLASRARIGTSAKAILWALVSTRGRHFDNPTNVPFITHDRMLEVTSLPDTTFRDNLRKLRDYGLLEWKSGRRGRATEYRLGGVFDAVEAELEKVSDSEIHADAKVSDSDPIGVGFQGNRCRNLPPLVPKSPFNKSLKEDHGGEDHRESSLNELEFEDQQDEASPSGLNESGCAPARPPDDAPRTRVRARSSNHRIVTGEDSEPAVSVTLPDDAGAGLLLSPVSEDVAMDAFCLSGWCWIEYTQEDLVLYSIEPIERDAAPPPDATRELVVIESAFEGISQVTAQPYYVVHTRPLGVLHAVSEEAYRQAVALRGQGLVTATVALGEQRHHLYAIEGREAA